MNVFSTALPEVLVIEPIAYRDPRGLFWESFNRRRFLESTGIDADFVQDNHSVSARGAIHGLHYQIRQSQGKLVRVIAGEVFDVAVDLRRASHNFGRWTATVLSAANRRQMWIPAGFAHGFQVMSESAQLLYKVTDYYAPQYERAILWNDPSIAIKWPINEPLLLSEKDRGAQLFVDAEVFE